jgi:hypothetical protein
MGSLYSLSLLVLLLVTFVNQICGSEVKNETNHRLVEGNKSSVRVYEAELEAFLRSVLKNGIPNFGIPHLDPLSYNDTIFINGTDMPGMIKIEYLELGDFEIDGLSAFEVHALSFQPFTLKIDLNFTFPIEVKAKHSNFSVIVGDILPFKGEGPANLIADLRVEASIGFEAVSPPDLFLRLHSLSGDIFFDKLEVEFSTLMGVTGGRGTYVLNKLIGVVTPELIDLMKPYMMDDLIKSLLNIANDFLDSAKIKLGDLLSCLQNKPECPFDV